MPLVRVPPISRSIPTPIAYQVERIESFAVEFDTDREWPDGNATHEQIAARARDIRFAQQLELDALDDEVRACYGMPPRKYAYKVPGAPDTRPAQPPAPVAPEAPRMQAPSSDPGLRHRARKAALRLQELTGQEVNAPFPSEEREAIKFVADLENEVRRLEAPAATGTAKYPPGKDVQAKARVCSKPHPEQRNAIIPGAITVAEWDFSVGKHGEPLCREHQAR